MRGCQRVRGVWWKVENGKRLKMCNTWLRGKLFNLAQLLSEKSKYL
jgi:hypothetical protein